MKVKTSEDFMKKAKAWWVLIKDDDQNLFNVIGPVTDDTRVTFRIVEEQKKGRSIRCETIPADRIREDVIRSWAEASGQTYTSKILLAP